MRLLRACICIGGPRVELAWWQQIISAVAVPLHQCHYTAMTTDVGFVRYSLNLHLLSGAAHPARLSPKPFLGLRVFSPTGLANPGQCCRGEPAPEPFGRYRLISSSSCTSIGAVPIGDGADHRRQPTGSRLLPQSRGSSGQKARQDLIVDAFGHGTLIFNHFQTNTRNGRLGAFGHSV